MFGLQLRHLLAIVGAVVIIGALGWLYASGRSSGYAKRDLECKAETAVLESRAIEAERQATALREKGRILADRLAAQAAEAQAQLDAAKRTADERINSMASAARRNLDAALVRLLNGLTPIRSSGGDPASAATAGTAAPVPAAASDPARPAAGYASERAVVRAIADCRIGYESCRVRHSALAEWAEAVTNPPR